VRRRRAAALAAPLVLLAVAAAPAAAQVPRVCAGHAIHDIRIQSQTLFAIEREPFSGLLQEIGNGVSWRTRPATVRRELRFHEGEPCDPRRLAESVRILRAQPYIRSAEIVTTPAPNDAVDVEVQTRDEWALSGSVRVDTDGRRALKAARVTEENLFGLGVLGQVRYDYFGRRAGFVLDVLDRQFLGHTDGEVVAGRTSVGPVGEVSLRRMFESEFDRVGWRADARYREEPFVFSARPFGTVTQPVVSAGVDVGLAWRTGPVGRQTVIGASASLERLFASGTPLAALETSDSAAAAALAGRFRERRRLAFDVFWGYRNVRFVRRAGLDAVNAPEDVREGFEVRLIGGRGIGGGGFEADWFALGDLYGGFPVGERTVAFVRGRGEGRSVSGGAGWQDFIAGADLFTYTTVSPRGSVAGSVQLAGGWRTSTPFQLLLAGPTTMHGYGYSGLPAGRRVVAQAEHRYFLGTVFGAAELGSALFVDVGRGWAGDAPFGENSGWLAAAGAGVRVGFPVGSHLATRLDVAVPLRHGQGVELRFTLRRQFGIGSREPDDVERSRLPVSNIAPFHFSRY